MNINPSTMKTLYDGFNTSFNKGLKSATSHWPKIAMKVSSSHAAEDYGWLEDTPGIREWLGDRIIHDLSGAQYRIKNRTFEETVAVPRENIEDDTYGIFGPRLEKLGFDVAQFPDGLVFDLVKDGVVTKCYDGNYFFDADHIGFDENGKEVAASNFTAGAGPKWYLFDCSQPLKPMIYQERRPFTFTSKTAPDDDNVFFQNKHIYGTDGRCNAGYGLWQLAYCSGATLNAANYEAARTAMATLRRPSGKPLGVMATHMVVPPVLEGLARQLINSMMINGGESNIWANSVELIVTAHVA